MFARRVGIHADRYRSMGLKLAFNVAWKSVAVVVAGIIVAFVLILALYS